MRYSNIHAARFLDRPNRFIAHCEKDGEILTVHVKNTGRCRELLVPGVTVWLTHSDNPARKTAWDLIAVKKGSRLINMDANAPNAAFGEFVRRGNFLAADCPVVGEDEFFAKNSEIPFILSGFVV